jgi:P4 family phage/plasmid primase-like protien
MNNNTPKQPEARNINSQITPEGENAAFMQAMLYCKMIAGQENPIVNFLFMPEKVSLTNGLDTAPDSKAFSTYDNLEPLLLRAYELQLQNYTPHLLLQSTEGEKATKNSITGCRVWALDIDSPITTEELHALASRLPPSFVVQTSPGKYHLFYCGLPGERYALEAGPKNPEQRYHFWIEAQKALMGVALSMGYNVDLNYRQITKRCRVPGFVRAIKQTTGAGEAYERFIPQIIWSSGGTQADNVARYSYNQISEMVGDDYMEQVNKVDEHLLAAKKERRAKSAANIAELRGSTNSSQPLNTIYDFSHFGNASQLLDPEYIVQSFPTPAAGERNEALFRFAFELATTAGGLIAQRGKEADHFNSDEELLTAIKACVECANDSLDEALDADEIEGLVASAFEYAKEVVSARLARQKAVRDAATSAPVPESVIKDVAVHADTVEKLEQTLFKYEYGAMDMDGLLSQKALAERIVQRFGHLMRRVGNEDQHGALYIFNGVQWVVHKDAVTSILIVLYGKVTHEIHLEKCYLDYVTNSKGEVSTHKKQILMTRLNSYPFLQSVLSIVGKHTDVTKCTPEEFEQVPFILNVKNGAIDLRSGELLAHAPEHFAQSTAPISWDETAMCPEWIGYLKSTFLENENDQEGIELVEYLHRLLGYMISGDMSEHIMVLLLGDGSNGKSILTSVLGSLLGGYIGFADESDFGSGKKGTIQFQKLSERIGVKFLGKRVIIGSEFSRGTVLREDYVKRITGQDITSARFLHQEVFDFKPTGKIIFGTNHMPVIEDDSVATWRRLRIVPFRFNFFTNDEKNRFADQVQSTSVRDRDRGLLERLQGELPGILRWCCLGYPKWAKDGLGAPPALVRHAIMSSHAANSPELHILKYAVCELTAQEKEQGVLGMTSTTVVNELAMELKKQLGAQATITMNAPRMGQYLTKRGFKSDRKRVYPVKLDFSFIPGIH